jgi:hypothetical protein
VRDLTADELAAIAAAYLTVTTPAETAPQRDDARWRLAGRLRTLDDTPRARAASRAATRWTMAGRLDD